jgi:hypothetical protein
MGIVGDEMLRRAKNPPGGLQERSLGVWPWWKGSGEGLGQGRWAGLLEASARLRQNLISMPITRAFAHVNPQEI